MAANDAEIDIGVNLDADMFTQEYENLLKTLSARTRDFITEAVSGMSGAPVKGWGPLPFATMHDATAGNTTTTQAFMASLAHDLQLHGIEPGSLGYNSAMLNATYRSTTPDPMQRYHQLLASGLTRQADLTHPDTPLGRAIESDYALMSQPWSRDFIRKGDKGKFINFDEMREYAVDAGLGRWKDEESEHTADNFELINNELEKIDENSNKSDKVFRGWNDTLKGVLGTLTAIGSLAGITKAFEVAYTASEKGTIEAGTTLDRRRGFVGMSALDELAAQTASKSIGLGQNAITNEIINLSNSREKYKLLGEGLNALFPSLTGVFDNIMSSENPMDVYKGILKEVYSNLQGADDSTKSRTLMLLESQGLGSAAQIIGSFLSNPKLAAQLGNDPTALFNLKNNSYYGSFTNAEAMLPEIEKLNASLSASYATLYTEWESAFGLPFKRWWDDTMQNKIIPWFEKVIEFTGIGKSKAWKAVDETTSGIALKIGIPGTGGAMDERNRYIELKSSRASYDMYKPQTFNAKNNNLGHLDWNNWLSGNMAYKKGEGARNMWDFYGRILDDYSEADLAGHPQALSTWQRIKYMVGKYEDTGLSTFLRNTKDESVDAYLLEALQMGAAGGKNWQSNFDAYVNKVLKIGLEGNIDNEILAELKEIAKNTEQKEELFKKDELWMMIEATYGKQVADSWKASLNRP